MGDTDRGLFQQLQLGRLLYDNGIAEQAGTELPQ
jgi:hypothetical protein